MHFSSPKVPTMTLIQTLWLFNYILANMKYPLFDDFVLNVCNKCRLYWKDT